MKAFESLRVPHDISKITNDLKKLAKIGTIHTIEITLDRNLELNDDLLSYSQGLGGLIHSNEIIFVNLPEISIDQIKKLLTQIYYFEGGLDSIEGILVHMQDTKASHVKYTVEIDNESNHPSLISVSDPAQYFVFLNYLKFMWASR